MKKFALKTTAGAIALLAAGLASAGVLNSDQTAYAGGTALASTDFAREALLDTTVVSAPGVAVKFDTFEVSTGVPYRIVLEVTNATFDKTASVLPDDTFALITTATKETAVDCVPVSFTGITDSQLAWECTATVHPDEGTKDKIGISFDPGTLKVLAPSLSTGGTVSIKAELQSREGFAIYDKVTATPYMAGVQAVVIAAANDNDTKTNVGTPAGPLFGFVASATVPADTVTAAAARFTVSNNQVSAVCPDASTTFDMNATCGDYVATNALKFTLKDSRSFQALATNGLTATGPNGAFPAAFTIAGDTATVTVTPTAGIFNSAGALSNVDVKYTASGDASLGSDRTIGFTGEINGGGQSFTGLNNSWWMWGNNGTILKFPAINQSSKTTNFVELLNTSPNAASLITAECFANKTNAVIGMKDKALAGNQSLVVELKYLCPGMKPNSVVLTVAAPAGDVTATAFSRNNETGTVTYVNAAQGNN